MSTASRSIPLPRVLEPDLILLAGHATGEPGARYTSSSTTLARHQVNLEPEQRGDAQRMLERRARLSALELDDESPPDPSLDGDILLGEAE